MNSSKGSTSRREFIKASGKSAVFSALANVAIPAVHAAASDLIQVALVGCGGRGGGAAANALRVKRGPVKLIAMADGLWRIAPGPNEAHARALLYRLGPIQYVDRVLLAWTRAREGAADPAWRDLATLPSRWTAPPFPLRAADFTTRGLVRGPALGEALRVAEAAWIASGFPHDKAALDTIADAAVRDTRAAPAAPAIG